MNIKEYLYSEDIEPSKEVDEYFSDLMETVFDLIDNLDYDNLTENQQDLIDEILELYEDDEDDEDDEEIDEVKAKRKKVVRKGRKVRKKMCPRGYKKVDGKCVRQSASERRTRSKAAKRAAKKRKGHKSSIQRKRKRSLRKRS